MVSVSSPMSAATAESSRSERWTRHCELAEGAAVQQSCRSSRRPPPHRVSRHPQSGHARRKPGSCRPGRGAPCACVALGAEVAVRGPDAERRVPPATSSSATSRRRSWLRRWSSQSGSRSSGPDRAGHSRKFARKTGDFALVAVGALVALGARRWRAPRSPSRGSGAAPSLARGRVGPPRRDVVRRAHGGDGGCGHRRGGRPRGRAAEGFRAACGRRARGACAQGRLQRGRLMRRCHVASSRHSITTRVNGAERRWRSTRGSC